jgi:2-amino-4-hydroxy-6-hydroxymethyldihydropteridine diphosphokinase
VHPGPDYVIGLGSNLGERLELLRAAVAKLDETPGLRVLARSAVYESEPLSLSPAAARGALRRLAEPAGASPHAGPRSAALLADEILTAPLQPRYLNAAVAIACPLPARALLDRLLAIEAELGRVRRERWGARTIDLDILWGRIELDEPGLTVPHPELPRRWFALWPLLEVAPALDARYAAARSQHPPPPEPYAAL